jgi:ketopantoate hydroxymethyltransferase
MATKIEKLGRVQILTIEIKTWAGRLRRPGIKVESGEAIVRKVRDMVEERVALMRELGMAPAGM